MAQLIQITNRSGLDNLQAMYERMSDLRPLMAEIGEDQMEATKRRFSTGKAPDGTPWAPNSAVTLGEYSAMFARKKDGTLSKKAQAKIAGKKPLTGETRALATTINYQITASNEVAIGSPMVYAAMQHFGGKKSQFPHLWGDIPARPIFGVSEADKANITELVRSYMLGE